MTEVNDRQQYPAAPPHDTDPHHTDPADRPEGSLTA